MILSRRRLLAALPHFAGLPAFLRTGAAQPAPSFPKVDTFTVNGDFGGWTRAQKDHFNGGALYDPVIAAAQSR